MREIAGYTTRVAGYFRCCLLYISLECRGAVGDKLCGADDSVPAHKYMEPYHHKECVCERAVGFNDPPLVYARMDEGSAEFYAIFLNLFHSCADISRSAFLQRDCAQMRSSACMDRSNIFHRRYSLEKGTAKLVVQGG